MSRVVLIRSNPIKPYPRLEKMANALIKSGHSVTVLAWDREENYKPRTEELVLLSGTVPIVRIGIKGVYSGGFRKNAWGLLKFQLFIINWLFNNKQKFDIVHAYDFDTGYSARLCASILNKKFIYDIPDYYVDSHNMSGKPIGRVVRKLENRVIDSADATIICTEERKQQIYGSHPKKLVVIHNTPDSAVVNNDITLKLPKSGRLKLVYVGVLQESRFIDKIVDVVSKRQDCEFHIGGFGSKMENYFENAAKSYNNVFFYGRIPYATTIQLERECDVMCALYDPSIPNHKYAAPNKFYEALFLGKPLIMAKNTGMASVVENNGIGVVIDYSEEGLNRAIDYLIANRAKWKDISNIEHCLYEEQYSWDVMQQRIINLYNEIGGKKNG